MSEQKAEQKPLEGLIRDSASQLHPVAWFHVGKLLELEPELADLIRTYLNGKQVKQ